MVNLKYVRMIHHKDSHKLNAFGRKHLDLSNLDCILRFGCHTTIFFCIYFLMYPFLCLALYSFFATLIFSSLLKAVTCLAAAISICLWLIQQDGGAQEAAFPTAHDELCHCQCLAH